MTLLELLRQELPKRGGWPEGAVKATSHGFIPGVHFWDDNDSMVDCIYLTTRELGGAIVTREQYEATGWDGIGLPPVGCDVEYHCYPDGWVIINIVARIKGATFIEWKSGTHKGGDIIRGDFPLERVRPLRTEAERAIDEMVRLSGVSIGAAKILYDAGYRK